MASIVNALAFACALTAIFVFRFDIRRPATLVVYFVTFGLVELAAQALLIPEGAVPVETAYVLFGITLLFVAAKLVTNKLDDANE